MHFSTLKVFKKYWTNLNLQIIGIIKDYTKSVLREEICGFYFEGNRKNLQLCISQLQLFYYHLKETVLGVTVLRIFYFKMPIMINLKNICYLMFYPR